jgi:hypothetical protein
MKPVACGPLKPKSSPPHRGSSRRAAHAAALRAAILLPFSATFFENKKSLSRLTAHALVTPTSIGTLRSASVTVKESSVSWGLFPFAVASISCNLGPARIPRSLRTLSRNRGLRGLCGGAACHGALPSEPVDNARAAAADNAVLYASVKALFACKSWVSVSVASVMDPVPLR